MKKSKSTSTIIILGVIAVLVFGIIFGAIMLTQNAGKKPGVVSSEKATNKLEKLYNKITINVIKPVKGTADLTPSDISTSLPEISKYPPQVDSTTTDFIEIFSSTEKAGTGTDAWLVDMANEFNKSNPTVNGASVSVRIRGIASGLGMDYISSGKYVPDVFSPSNELWGKMLSAQGIKVTLAESRLTGNVAGILFSKAKSSELKNKYGSINLRNVTDAVTNDQLAMGYTNPLASSAGLNFLVSTLYTFDSKDPLSDNAREAFENFQNNIPFVAYTTLQMRESAKSGALDGFILEYQSYFNLPDIKSAYDFTPYGVRHDSPVYEIGELTELKKEILKQFIDFCKTEKSQQLASNYGFNNLDDYKWELGEIKDDVILPAQKLWREKKSGSKDIAAVFVADISGSMEGDPMLRLKESLKKGSQNIANNNYIGLVTFSDDVNIVLPLAKFDINQRALLAGAVDNMQAGGATAMFDGIIVGTKMLTDFMEQNSNIKPLLFVLTDGETNRGHNLNDIRGIMEDLKIPIYTIGYNAEISGLQAVSAINEAASINADTEDVVYQLDSFFKAQM